MLRAPHAISILLCLTWFALQPARSVAAPAQSMPPVTGYRLPFPAGDRFFVTRGGTGHGNAVDFFPQQGEGAIIVAARAGWVTRVVESSVTCACNSPANYVRIQHAGDPLADEYLHIQYDSASEFGIAPGVNVAQGQPIARVGNTGCTLPCDAYHLHLHVYDAQMNFYPIVFDELGQAINVAWDGNLQNTLPSPPCLSDCIGDVVNGERPLFESSTAWSEDNRQPASQASPPAE